MDDEVKRYIDRLFAKHARRQRNAAGRGVVSMVQDGHKLQENQLQMLDGEVLEGAERVQQYGFTSHPQADAEAFVIFADGDRAHPLIISVDDRRYRLQGLAAGEVALYTDEGDKIVLKRQNTIEVTTKHWVIRAEEDCTVETRRFTVNASEGAAIHSPGLDLSGAGGGDTTATMSGSLRASGDLKSNGGAVSLNSHVHEGVQPGGGTSDKPQGGV